MSLTGGTEEPHASDESKCFWKVWAVMSAVTFNRDRNEPDQLENRPSV